MYNETELNHLSVSAFFPQLRVTPVPLLVCDDKCAMHFKFEWSGPLLQGHILLPDNFFQPTNISM